MIPQSVPIATLALAKLLVLGATVALGIGVPMRAWADPPVRLPFVSDSPITRRSPLERMEPDGPPATVVLVGGQFIPDEARQAFAKAVPPQGRVLVLVARLAGADDTEGGEAADDAVPADPQLEEIRQSLTAAGIAAPIVMRLPQPDLDDAWTLVKNDTWGGLWLSGPAEPFAAHLASVVGGECLLTALDQVIRQGGAIGGSGGVTGLLGSIHFGPSEDGSDDRAGLELIPDSIITADADQERRAERLRAVVARRPDRFGLSIDDATTLLVRGRRFEVVGQGTAAITLAAGPGREAAEVAIPSGSIGDLTQLCRAARWRGSELDPGEPTSGPAEVASGSLVIVGGGGMPRAIVERFVQLAGGEQARIVVLPTAVSRAEAFASQPPGFLTRAGVASVRMLPQSRTDEVSSDEFREALATATGVWFDGGRQWNFVDAYENTPAVEMFHDVLRRGGVIGGSSAGATIQGEYLVRGHPLGNQVMMAEGYERGFGFLPGVAIDQHFTQRGRQVDLIPVIRRHRKLIGIGIDEATALVVSGAKAEVIGNFAAHFVSADRIAASDAQESADANSPYISVPAGRAIDLKTLTLIEPEPAAPEPAAPATPEPAKPPGELVEPVKPGEPGEPAR